MLGTKRQRLIKKGMILTVVLCCLFATCPSSVGAEPVQIPEKSEEYVKGSALSNQGKKDEARALYEAGAEKGDAWCIYSLGVFYNEGLGGLKKNEARAFVMIKRAADLNLPAAYHYLGDAYFEGSRLVGLIRNVKKGEEYFAIAGNLGDVKAYADLGKIYLWGKYSIYNKDIKKGIEYLTKAADLNDAESAGFLGRAYIFGDEGLRKDEEKGVEMLEKAAELNDPDGLRDLGYLYSNGLCGVSKDAKKGKELTKKAAALKKPDLNVTPNAIVQDYESNVITAGMKYAGKVVRMRGLIGRVGKADDRAYAIITTGWYHQDIICYFEEGRFYEAVPLKTGFNATIQGRVGKEYRDGVILYDCWVIPTN